mgnify:CR=1 FL=1
MPKTKQQKQAIVQELEAKLAQARAVIFTSFNALPVKESESLRQKLIKEQGEFWAVKKTLLSRALESLPAAEERPNVKEFDGQVAVVLLMVIKLHQLKSFMTSKKMMKLIG